MRSENTASKNALKIVIFGSTGPSGRCLVARAVAEGHDVVAFARKASAFEGSEGISVTEGDATDAADVDGAVRGADVVVNAIGPRNRASAGPVTVDVASVSTANILSAMDRHDVRRLVVLSAMGVGDSLPVAGFVFGRMIVPLLLRREFADKHRQEALVRGSTCDWTIVRPSRLTAAASRRAYRVAGAAERVPASIARADVADFVITRALMGEHVRQTVNIGG